MGEGKEGGGEGGGGRTLVTSTRMWGQGRNRFALCLGVQLAQGKLPADGKVASERSQQERMLWELSG